MTTISYRDGVMAADSQCTCSHITRVKKIHRLPDGSLIGGCGGAQDCDKGIEWLRNGQQGEPPQISEACFLIVDPKGRIRVAEGEFPGFRLRDKFAAIGSGAPFAIAAMEMGADAVQAIKVAAKHDTGTSAPIHKLNLK